MLKHSEIVKIKKLIKHGFDLELISFELDIPMEEVKKCDLELRMEEKSKTVKTYSVKEIMEKRNRVAHLRMEEMRRKYKNLYFRNNKIETSKPKEMTEKEKEYIDTNIAEIKRLIEESEILSKDEKKQKIKIIFAILKQLENCQLDINQAEELYLLLKSENLMGTDFIEIINFKKNLNRMQKRMLSKFAEAIDVAQLQTEDVEELKTIDSKLTIEMMKEYPTVIGAIKSKIQNKIVGINQKKVINTMKNNIPEKIENIIKDLANGSLDIQEANEAIDEEVKNRMEGKSENKFRLTEEQERKQILIQIRKNLMENPEKYYIEDPEITIMKLEELCNGELQQAIRTVVKNLINIKDFERAKKICNQFLERSGENPVSIYIRKLRKEIRNEEIADIVLKGINMNGNEDEERIYFEMIDEGLKKGHVKLGAISLGKSQDGLRNITLKDLWTDEDRSDR